MSSDPQLTPTEKAPSRKPSRQVLRALAMKNDLAGVEAILQEEATGIRETFLRIKKDAKTAEADLLRDQHVQQEIDRYRKIADRAERRRRDRRSDDGDKTDTRVDS